MKKVARFTCDQCRGEYDSEEEALACERDCIARAGQNAAMERWNKIEDVAWRFTMADVERIEALVNEILAASPGSSVVSVGGTPPHGEEIPVLPGQRSLFG